MMASLRTLVRYAIEGRVAVAGFAQPQFRAYLRFDKGFFAKQTHRVEFRLASRRVGVAVELLTVAGALLLLCALLVKARRPVLTSGGSLRDVGASSQLYTVAP